MNFAAMNTPGNSLAQEKMIHVLKELGIRKDVLDAMAKVPRDKFLSPALKREAYEDSALPIGEKQTISQPKVVALMTHALDVKPNHKVLEIGTGCGYQTAILCKLARRVFTIERFESLKNDADKRLQSMVISNYITKVGDGTLGWPGQAPFDRIIVTAAGPTPPQALLDQLGPDGVMVMPVGDPHSASQRLMRYYRRTDGSIGDYYLGEVRFVPLIGKQGVKE